MEALDLHLVNGLKGKIDVDSLEGEEWTASTVATINGASLGTGSNTLPMNSGKAVCAGGSATAKAVRRRSGTGAHGLGRGPDAWTLN